MTDIELIRRHAREFAGLIGANPECAVSAIAVDFRWRAQWVPNSIMARRAAIRIGLGIGQCPLAVARALDCHPSEVLRPRAIDPGAQIDRIGKRRRRALVNR